MKVQFPSDKRFTLICQCDFIQTIERELNKEVGRQFSEWFIDAKYFIYILLES